jgi:hypothetical protein
MLGRQKFIISTSYIRGPNRNVWCEIVDELDIVSMAGGGGCGEWSTYILIYTFKLCCCTLGLDFDDILLMSGLDA